MFSPVKARSLTAIRFFPVILVFMLGAVSQAQDQRRPVARLLAYDADPTASRPRLVGSAAGEVSSILPSLSEATGVEKSAFEKTNEARLANGLAPLAWDADLCLLARAHSESMGRIGYFDHATPEGLQLKDRARAMGIKGFKVIGENIAYNKGYSDPGAFAVERWLKSGGHRANMLHAGFQASAIGSYISSDGSVYLTQVFITR